MITDLYFLNARSESEILEVIYQEGIERGKGENHRAPYNMGPRNSMTSLMELHDAQPTENRFLPNRLMNFVCLARKHLKRGPIF